MHCSPHTTNSMNAHLVACSFAFAAMPVGLVTVVVAKATTKIRDGWTSGGLREGKGSKI